MFCIGNFLETEDCEKWLGLHCDKHGISMLVCLHIWMARRH